MSRRASHRRFPHRRVLGLLAALVPLILAGTVDAAPTLGFLETWPGTSVQAWGGSILITYSNPGTGGVGGNGDGFLLMTKPDPPGNFGTRSTGLEYLGNWQAAGVTQVRFWLNDVGADEALEIHFAVGGFNNLWEYKPGFIPPLGRWAEFIVDLADSNDFSHIILLNGMNFDAALQSVEVVHIRHDKAPYVQSPDPLSGDLGIDQLLLTDGVVGIGPPPPGVGRPVELAPPYPNPSRGPVALTLSTHEPGAARLEILDPQGRRVRRAELPFGPAGTRIWTWDGRDEQGRRVPAGVYRARAIGPAGGTSRPLVRVD